MKKTSKVENASFVTRGQESAATWRTKRPFEWTIVTNVLKNDSAFVAAEKVVCERINITSTNNFKITELKIEVRLI